MADQTNPTLRYLRRPGVRDKTGLGNTRIDILEARGQFPRRHRLSARAVGWLEHEVDEWIRSRPFGDVVRPDPAGDLPRKLSA